MAMGWVSWRALPIRIRIRILLAQVGGEEKAKENLRHHVARDEGSPSDNHDDDSDGDGGRGTNADLVCFAPAASS